MTTLQKGHREMTEKAPEKAPTANNTCKCGCKTKVVRQFSQGHDARHASNLRRAVAAGKMTSEAALKAASDISPAFVGKLQKSLDNLAREQVKDEAK